MAPTPVTPAVQTGDDQLRSIFDDSPIGLALVALGHGIEGRLMTANAVLAGILAMPAEQLISVPMTDVIVERDHARFHKVLARLTRGDAASARLSLHLRARGRKEVEVVVHLSVATDDTGRWRCAIAQVVPS